jgi:flagellar protein FlgJ
MRVDGGEPSLVIVPVAAPAPAPARTFREHLATRTDSARLSRSAARTLLGNAWAQVVGSTPDPKTAALLTAHWALETDAGRAMPGHNFAGIKASPAAPGAWLRTVEGHGATRREVSARFRVYESAAAGAHDYVRLLQTRFPAALEAAQAGNSAGFAQALAAGGYFTADPRLYAAGLQQRLAEVESGMSGNSPATRSADSGPARGSVAEAALGGLLHALRESRDDASEGA